MPGNWLAALLFYGSILFQFLLLHALLEQVRRVALLHLRLELSRRDLDSLTGEPLLNVLEQDLLGLLVQLALVLQALLEIVLQAPLLRTGCLF